MSVYETNNIGELIGGNAYVGRGLILGRTADGEKAAVAYFIMGRSENSRNRVFTEQGDEVIIRPFDPALVTDPSLIIYSPIKRAGAHLIVTNGDQTDTIYEYISAGRSFEDALMTRSFEPDAPNLTPRISGIITFGDGDFTYKLSILKSADATGSACVRQFFAYPALNGLGHLLHTYACNGDPLPSFTGEPRRVNIPNDIDRLTDGVWSALDAGNRISLYVRYVSLKTGEAENRLINKKRG